MALRDASARGSAGYDHAELVRAAGALLRYAARTQSQALAARAEPWLG